MLSRGTIIKLKKLMKNRLVQVVLCLVTVAIVTIAAVSVYMSPSNNVPSNSPQTCNRKFTLPHIVTKDKFQKVKGRNIYFYSAYYDKREGNEPTIRIIGVSLNDPDPLFCEVYHGNGESTSLPVEGILAVPKDDDGKYIGMHNYWYKPYVFSCNGTLSEPIVAVSLTTSPCRPPTSALRVLTVHGYYKKDEYVGTHAKALCAKTLHAIKSPYRVIEFIELHRQLGVTCFYLYKLGAVSSLVKPVIEYYVNLGILFMVEWDYRLENSTSLSNESVTSINNDCLYRSANEHELVVLQDFDEFIIPRRPHIKTIQDLLYLIHEHNNYHLQNVYASYSFYECYFCLKQTDNSQICSQVFALKRTKRHMCLKTEMDKEWWQDVVKLKERQLETRKSIIHPKRVVVMGTHVVLLVVPGYKKEFKMPTYFASMNRYVYQENDAMKCNIKDETVTRNYLTEVKPKINKICSDLDLDTIP